MPREIVQSADPIDETPFGVQVGWSGEAPYVQVASVTHRQRSFWWQILASTDEPEGSEERPDGLTKRLTVLGELVRAVVEEHAAIDNGTTGRSASPAADVGAAFLNRLDTTYGPIDGLYVDLDRRGINLLIRLLRKARDAAFGRDE